jgi:molybdopterin-guanine dinucleotide biosynthesis protein
MRRTTIAVSGFSSNAGKTTLMCELLRAFPGWEAIKMTRGHYRSCGKDPHACCVSHLLQDEPVIRSGRAETYAPGKDTGRYWEAGASNVHWAIVTDQQVEQGITEALRRVRAAGVLVEGTSFVNYLDVDLMLMCARASGGKIKASARRMMKRASALYLFEEDEDGADARSKFIPWLEASGESHLVEGIPVYTRSELPLLIEHLQKLEQRHGILTAEDAERRRGKKIMQG